MTHPIDNLVRLQAAAPMELRATETGDGNTLVGHFAVYDTWTEIKSMWEGNFLERVAPGAFDQTFKDRAKQIRVLYDHGHDPSVGNKPLGTPDVLRSDKTGAYYEVRLFDAPYVNDLKPAIAAGQMGASFRFSVTSEAWTEPSKPSSWNPASLPERTITAVDLYEFGPVTFPAYANATAGLRSTSDEFYDRLAADPLFVARFTERVGAGIVTKLLTKGAADGPPLSTSRAPDGSRAVPAGRLVAACKSTTYSLKGAK